MGLAGGVWGPEFLSEGTLVILGLGSLSQDGGLETHKPISEC